MSFFDFPRWFLKRHEAEQQPHTDFSSSLEGLAHHEIHAEKLKQPQASVVNKGGRPKGSKNREKLSKVETK